MTEEGYIEYVRHMKAEGKTEEQITVALINSGLSEDDTPRIMAEANKKPAPVAEKPAEPEKAKEKKGWWPFKK